MTRPHPGTDKPINLDALRIPCEYDVPLGPLTWYGVGGRARVIAHPSSIAQLSALVMQCRQCNWPMYVLGDGANLLVRDCGVEGVVVQLDDPAFRQVTIDGDRVTVGSGADLMKLVLQLAREGLAGLEVVAGVPGTVGGAVKMNAGGAYGEIGAFVCRVQVMADNGHVYYRDRDDLEFSYRTSNISAPFILEVQFELDREQPERLMRRVKEIFFYKRSTQPLAQHSAGCAFKNPTKDISLTAGQLIDRAGLKGYTLGGAKVSDQHANFIIVEPESARADDIAAIIAHIQKVVDERFGVELQREVVIWP